jgi:uracil-DNA glycosylase
VPDARKPLPVLRDEWEKCCRCELGRKRQKHKGHVVFGGYYGLYAGQPDVRCVMFIGESPNKWDERNGDVFASREGEIFKYWVHHHQLMNVYTSNGVLCRNQEPYMDRDTNEQKVNDDGSLAWVDRPPAPEHTRECRARLYEEIYIVDPVLIITLGGYALQAVFGGTMQNIDNEHGKLRELEIPGNGVVPLLTPKGKWGRRSKGVWNWPTEQRMVKYPVIPLHSLSHINRNSDNPRLIEGVNADMAFAVSMYNAVLSR